MSQSQTKTHRYVVQADTPRLGKAGAVVEMQPGAAQYLVLSGQLLTEEAHKAREAERAKAAAARAASTSAETEQPADVKPVRRGK